MNRLSRALEALSTRHRPRGPEAVLAAARQEARGARARHRALLGAGIAASVLALGGLAVWATADDDPTRVESGPIDVPPTEVPTTLPASTTTEAVATTTSTPEGTTTTSTAPPGTRGTIVEVHFSNDDGADFEGCTQTSPVERRVDGPAVLDGALRALLAGPTQTERDAGLTSWFSQDPADLIRSVTVRNGIAQVDFDARFPSAVPNASTACGSSSLRAQLDRTARQFPTVGRVIFSVDGSVDGFYGWLQAPSPDLTPRWGGSLEEVWPSGQLQAPGFNQVVADTRIASTWKFDPREAAMVLLDLASIEDSLDVEIEHETLDDRRTIVTVTQAGFLDDSVNATQHRFVFDHPDGVGTPVRFVEGTVATRCQPGRGHQDFRTELCV
jgi:hypothetical protein